MWKKPQAEVSLLWHGMAWDDGGMFGIYQRGSREWNEVKDILIYYSAKSPKGFTGSINEEGKAALTWKSRYADHDKVILQKW